MARLFPPRLSYSPDELLISTNIDQLARIWAVHPNIQNFNSPKTWIDQEFGLEKDKSLREL